MAVEPKFPRKPKASMRGLSSSEMASLRVAGDQPVCDLAPFLVKRQRILDRRWRLVEPRRRSVPDRIGDQSGDFEEADRPAR